MFSDNIYASIELCSYEQNGNLISIYNIYLYQYSLLIHLTKNAAEKPLKWKSNIENKHLFEIYQVK